MSTQIRIVISVEVDGPLAAGHPSLQQWRFAYSEQDNPRFYDQNVRDAFRKATTVVADTWKKP